VYKEGAQVTSSTAYSKLTQQYPFAQLLTRATELPSRQSWSMATKDSIRWVELREKRRISFDKMLTHKNSRQNLVVSLVHSRTKWYVLPCRYWDGLSANDKHGETPL